MLFGRVDDAERAREEDERGGVTISFFSLVSVGRRMLFLLEDCRMRVIFLLEEAVVYKKIESKRFGVRLYVFIIIEVKELAI